MLKKIKMVRFEKQTKLLHTTSTMLISLDPQSLKAVTAKLNKK